MSDTQTEDDRQPIQHDGLTFHPVPGEPRLFCTECGRVGCTKDDGSFKHLNKRWRRQSGRYIVVCPRSEIKPHILERHPSQLFWLTFRGPIPSGMTVWHLDGNPRNDDPTNLKLERILIRNSGSINHNAKLTRRQVMEIRSSLDMQNGELAAKYGCSVDTICDARLGLRYKDVPMPVRAPACEAARAHLIQMLTDTEVSPIVAEDIARRIDADGIIKIGATQMATRTGLSVVSIKHQVSKATKRQALTKLRVGYWRASLPSSDAESIERHRHMWQEQLASEMATEFQSRVLAIRVRDALRAMPDLPPTLADDITSHVKRDGTFLHADILDPVGRYKGKKVDSVLIESGVVERINFRYRRFLSMPPREKALDDPLKVDEQLTAIEKSNAATIDDYRESVALIAMGHVPLPDIAHDTGVVLTVVTKLARSLTVDQVLRTLVANGKIDDAAKIFSLPPDAAKALAEHARKSYPGIQPPR